MDADVHNTLKIVTNTQSDYISYLHWKSASNLNANYFLKASGKSRQFFGNLSEPSPPPPDDKLAGTNLNLYRRVEVNFGHSRFKNPVTTLQELKNTKFDVFYVDVTSYIRLKIKGREIFKMNFCFQKSTPVRKRKEFQ